MRLKCRVKTKFFLNFRENLFLCLSPANQHRILCWNDSDWVVMDLKMLCRLVFNDSSRIKSVRHRDIPPKFRIRIESTKNPFPAHRSSSDFLPTALFYWRHFELMLWHLSITLYLLWSNFRWSMRLATNLRLVVLWGYLLLATVNSE